MESKRQGRGEYAKGCVIYVFLSTLKIRYSVLFNEKKIVSGKKTFLKCEKPVSALENRKIFIFDIQNGVTKNKYILQK